MSRGFDRAQFIEDWHGKYCRPDCDGRFIAFLVWLGVRASRAKSALAKWGGMVLTAMLAIALSGVSALTAVGIVRQHARSAPVPDLKIEATPDQIARGRAVADGFCAGCHSQTGS